MNRFRFESSSPTYAKLWLDDVEVMCQRVEFTAGVEQVHQVNLIGVYVGDGVAIDTEAKAEVEPQPVASNFKVTAPADISAADVAALHPNKRPGRSMDFFEWRRRGWSD